MVRNMVDYELICKQIKALAEESTESMPIMANASALIYHAMPDINWAGFYIVRNEELLLGPFQGNVACVLIARGRGVCGTAWETDSTQLVPDVHEFPGHIACDAASRSEIVIPIHRDGEVIAVLDIDSPSVNRFSNEDKDGLEAFVRVLEEIGL